MLTYSDQKGNVPIYHKISKINEKVNTIFILPVTLMSFFDVALNIRNAGRGSSFCVWLFSCNDSMSLVARKRFLRLSVMYRLGSNVQRNLSTLTSAQRITISIFL